jgi:hypothetical protein
VITRLFGKAGSKLAKTTPLRGDLFGLSFKLSDLVPLPTDQDNLVRQQNDYGRERDPGGQSVALKEI